jgi:hypothetical protein
MTTLDVSIQGTSGDADLYVRYAALPGLELWDARRPYFAGSTERAIINNVPAGDSMPVLGNVLLEVGGPNELVHWRSRGIVLAGC